VLGGVLVTVAAVLAPPSPALWGLLAIGGLLLTAAAIEVYGSDDVQTAQDIVDDARGSASDDDE